jgi:hypothetical protein
MTRLMTSGLAVVALLAAATTVLRSHSPTTNGAVGMAGMPTLQELQSAAGTDKLPIENFEDRSLVYPREMEH